MGLVYIQNGESGLDVRNALNSMFAELFGAITAPIITGNITGNTSIPNIPSNTFIDSIGINTNAAITVRIGVTPGGNELLDDISINGFQLIVTQYYLASLSTIYITFVSGSGTLNARFNAIYNYL